MIKSNGQPVPVQSMKTNQVADQNSCFTQSLFLGLQFRPDVQTLENKNKF